jgi:hypothetical protein
LLVDDVQVFVPTSELPAPTETPTESVELTPEATPLVEETAEPLDTGEVIALGVTFTVNNTSNDSDANTADDLCDTDLATSGNQCSLRAAIEQANATAGTDTIAFNIPGIGVQTIFTVLPTITDPVIIDGTTQPGYAGVPLIQLKGCGVYCPHGLHIIAGNTTVKGLIINRFGNGIELGGSGGNVIQGNYIGTDATGTVSLRNGSGVYINNAPNNTIGGTTAAARNIISGNDHNGIYIESSSATGNLVQGASSAPMQRARLPWGTICPAYTSIMRPIT